MSINRQNLNEEYFVTADWLVDFANQLFKNSYNIENLKNIREMDEIKKTFSTIEEKLDDIKNRIGFQAIESIHKESEQNSKFSSEKKSDCKCQGEGNCSCTVKKANEYKSTDLKYEEEDIKSMETILRYIKDLIRFEYHSLTPIMVINRCRQEPGLRFDHLPINFDKLNKFIEKEFEKYNTVEQDVNYIPYDNNQSNLQQNQDADYWTHAFPNKT